MNEEGRQHDPLLDAALDEVLGGHRPPDLAPRIAQAWSFRSAPGVAVPGNGVGYPLQAIPQNGRGAYPAAPMAEFVGLAQPAARPIPVSPAQPAAPLAETTAPPRAESATPGSGVPSVHDRPRTLLPGRDQQAWMTWVVACSLLVAAALGGYLAWQNLGPGGVPPAPPMANDSRGKQPDRPALVKHDAKHETPRVEVKNTLPPGIHVPGHVPEVLVKGSNPPAGPTAQPLTDEEVVQAIDQSLAAAWLDHGVQPAEPADDSEWCRRLFLRTLGRIHTQQELRAFLASAEPNKRAQLIDRLLTAPEYSDELARHWSVVWTGVLVGRVADDARREGLRSYLEQAIGANTPYDKLVTDLVTAAGSPEANGAANFLLALVDKDERAVRTTSRTTQVLLGMQMDCARCHDHPFQKMGPAHYWAANGFFRQMEVHQDGGSPELAKVDFAGEQPGEAAAGAGVLYRDAAGQEQIAYPRLPGGEEIARSGLVAEVDRRQELARQIVSSPDFGRTLVNRLWTHFFSVGFVRPGDRLSPRSQPSHPELVDQLAGQVAAHKYDLRKAMRWIVSSEAFALSSHAGTPDSTDEPLAGNAPLFSRYYVRPSTAERIDQSLLTLAEAVRIGRNLDEEKATIVWGRFAPDLPRSPESLSIEAPPSSAPSGQRVDTSEGSLLDRLATSKLAQRDKIAHLFLAAFGREPSAKELAAADQLFAARKGDTLAALQDLWWALLHSNEFAQGL